ncbi:MAG: bifunctional hydroxymethylpyrimidine kinase/phosphomethylpyrimidine kinase [Armatimonadota bacterium]
MRCVLTIAASDSSCGAGVQADLAVFRDFNLYGLCVVTNVTAQNSSGVQKINKVPPTIIASQIDSCVKDFNVAACKIGMLYHPTAVGIVSERISRRKIPNVVLDPVMEAKNGECLLTPTAFKRLKKQLFPKATVITPNINEASRICGIDIVNKEDIILSAKKIYDMGCKNVLIKGGHLLGKPLDILYNGKDIFEFEDERLEKRMHGTGCVLSSAIAAELANGLEINDAVSNAKKYVTRAIEFSQKLGKKNMDYFVGVKNTIADS